MNAFCPFEEVDAKLLKIRKSVFGRGVDFLTSLHARSGQRPPKLGGQHGRSPCEGWFPRKAYTDAPVEPPLARSRLRLDRAALLTQEGENAFLGLIC